MSLNQKILTVPILIIFFGIFGSVWYYRHTHPRYTPPPPKEEVTLTIIPGWNLRQVAEYLARKGFASSTADVYKVTGQPALDYRNVKQDVPILNNDILTFGDKPHYVSYEGYLAPETYRVFRDASVRDIIEKLIDQRVAEFSEIFLPGSPKITPATGVYQYLTMASILEKEVQKNNDKAKVADILWRRYNKNWALQVDSSVHYAVDKRGEVFTKKEEREFDSYWNTYKYPGLPLGPISNPSVASIQAALNPEKNDYWYFLTTQEGEVKYARTLEEHNANKARYLR